jgi:hypothetical protein
VLAIDLDHIPVLGPRPYSCHSQNLGCVATKCSPYPYMCAIAQTTLIIDCMVLLSELSSHAVGIAPLQAAVTIGRYW